MTSVVGTLALQGAFARHIAALRRCGVDAIEVRTPAQLAQVDALVIPGGESGVISKLLVSNGLKDELGERLAEGMPTFGTCAGMIMLSAEILDGRTDQFCYDRVDIAVRRNGYGRQIDSFEADLTVTALGPDPLRAVFIRAPKVERVGPDVEVLASVDEVPVICRQGPVLVASFHPELTDDIRLHQLFVSGLAGIGPDGGPDDPIE